MERLVVYVTMLEKWTAKINLVSRSTMADVWTRHVLDSLQLLRLAPERVDTWVDMGSGAGLPGAIVAIASHDTAAIGRMILVESDSRKCAFLRNVLRETGIDAEIRNERVELLPSLQANVLSARALTDLSGLLMFQGRHGAPGSIGLYPKGRRWLEEVAAARKRWEFSYDAVISQTDPSSVILKIGEPTSV